MTLLACLQYLRALRASQVGSSINLMVQVVDRLNRLRKTLRCVYYSHARVTD